MPATPISGRNITSARILSGPWEEIRMLDPTIIVAIVKASGGLLQEVLKRSTSAGEQATQVISKTYEKVAPAITTNSLRVLIVLKQEGSSLMPEQILVRVSALAKRQEPDGARYESDLEYRLKFLSVLGLVQQVGGLEFALTHLGAAFIDASQRDSFRYKAAFAQTY
jgi:hypothetical protein